MVKVVLNSSIGEFFKQGDYGVGWRIRVQGYPCQEWPKAESRSEELRSLNDNILYVMPFELSTERPEGYRPES